MTSSSFCYVGGEGKHFCNPKPLSILSFGRESISILQQYFPERLSQCILFPMPKSAMIFFKMVRPFIDVDTRKRLVVISGDSSRSAKIPKGKLAAHISPENIDVLEDRRLSFFE